jgi:hypothetical protein
MQLAEMMARGKLMPDHLKNAGDALMVIEQAMRWQMSPFAVAQSTFNIKGKLLFAGALVAAAIENSGAIQGLIDYQFSGSGDTRMVTVIATRRGETEPKTVEVMLKDARTENGIWKKQPDQQLCYHGARVWGRRWAPGVMLGVYSPEELEAPAERHSGPTIDATAEEAPPAPATFLSRATIALESSDSAAKTMALLQRIMPQCPTMDDFTAIRAIPLVRSWEKNAPSEAQVQITAIWRAVVDRLAPKAEAEVSDAAEPVLIQAFSADGEPLPPPLMLPIVFAKWFAVNYARQSDSTAMLEHNADAIADAGIDPEAAKIIQAALDDATMPF